MIKNPNWQEADQLAIYKHDRGFELGTTENVKKIKTVYWSRLFQKRFILKQLDYSLSISMRDS